MESVCIDRCDIIKEIIIFFEQREHYIIDVKYDIDKCIMQFLEFNYENVTYMPTIVMDANMLIIDVFFEEVTYMKIPDSQYTLSINQLYQKYKNTII